jgi:hypothetical protein
MTHLQQYKFQQVIKGLFSCTDELQAQLAQTRLQCQQIEEVMIAIRHNPSIARNHVLPKCPYGRDQAAND